MTGIGMIWPLASVYCRSGWAVRREGWKNADTLGDSGDAVRWVVYHNALFWLVYRDEGGVPQSRVIENADFERSEFLADDWTVFAPECLADPNIGKAEPDLQGKQPYPIGDGESPTQDPLSPNGFFGGSCPLPPRIDEQPPDIGKGSGGSALSGSVSPPSVSGGSAAGSVADSGGSGAAPALPTGAGGSLAFGGASGRGGRARKRRSTPPTAAAVSITVAASTPACHVVGTDNPEETFSGTVSLADDAGEVGLYWVTVTAAGRVVFTGTMEKGDSESWGPVTLAGTPDKSVFGFQATAYLPIKRCTSRDSELRKMHWWCSEGDELPP